MQERPDQSDAPHKPRSSFPLVPYQPASCQLLIAITKKTACMMLTGL